MRNVPAAVLCLLSLGLFSCQKELSDSSSTSGAGNPSGTLRRTVIRQGADSSITDYSYDNSGKLIAVNTTNADSTYYSYEVIKRNSQGIIQTVTTKASDLVQVGVDSIVAVLSSSSGRYMNRVIKFSSSGQDITLTSVYFYDANGRISSQKDYVDDGAGSIDSSRTDYTYTGANLATLKGYSLNSGSTTPDLTQLFEYDSKPSPLIVGNEAFILNNFIQWTSANNITKLTVNVAGDPDTHIETWNYNYNASSRPAGAAIVQDGQGGITMNYYYK